MPIRAITTRGGSIAHDREKPRGAPALSQSRIPPLYRPRPNAPCMPFRRDKAYPRTGRSIRKKAARSRLATAIVSLDIAAGPYRAEGQQTIPID